MGGSGGSSRPRNRISAGHPGPRYAFRFRPRVMCGLGRNGRGGQEFRTSFVEKPIDTRDQEESSTHRAENPYEFRFVPHRPLHYGATEVGESGSNAQDRDPSNAPQGYFPGWHDCGQTGETNNLGSGVMKLWVASRSGPDPGAAKIGLNGTTGASAGSSRAASHPPRVERTRRYCASSRSGWRFLERLFPS